MTATKTTTASLTLLAKITATDRRDAADALTAAGIDSVPGPNRSNLYPLFDAVRCLVDRKEGAAQSAAEQHHIAGAKLKDAQRAKIEREWMPLAEARLIAARMAGITSTWVEDSGLPMEEQNRLMVRIQEMVSDGLKGPAE
jgi:hypothetical protein